MKPVRIQLRRANGWRIPPNTVKVDRSTPWGNPFVVGRDGTAAECVELFKTLLGIGLCLTCKAEIADQRAAREHIVKNYRSLKGKNLACWCKLGQPCHADVLLEIANGDTP